MIVRDNSKEISHGTFGVMFFGEYLSCAFVLEKNCSNKCTAFCFEGKSNLARCLRGDFVIGKFIKE